MRPFQLDVWWHQRSTTEYVGPRVATAVLHKGKQDRASGTGYHQQILICNVAKHGHIDHESAAELANTRPPPLTDDADSCAWIDLDQLVTM
jgi:hypothetical protein